MLCVTCHASEMLCHSARDLSRLVGSTSADVSCSRALYSIRSDTNRNEFELVFTMAELESVSI